INMILSLEKSNKQELLNKCVNDIKRNIVPKQGDPIYEKDSFEYIWYYINFNKLLEEENKKDKQRHDFCLKLLKQVFNKNEEEISKLINISFEDPIKKINPFVFTIMKNVFNKNFDYMQEYKSLYRKDNENYI